MNKLLAIAFTVLVGGIDGTSAQTYPDRAIKVVVPYPAIELIGRQPDVIVTTGTPSTLAAKRATSTIPIVFASSGNPVLAGLVASTRAPAGM